MGESLEAIVARLDERTEGIGRDIKDIKNYMATRPCPSNLCQKHDRAITRIDTTIKVVATIAIFVIPLALTVLMFLVRA
jgi:hypothetical protein